MNTQGEGSVVVRSPPPSKRLLKEQASQLYSHEACPRSRCRSLAADAAACGPARSARAGAPAPALMRRGHPVPLPLRSCAAPGHSRYARARRPPALRLPPSGPGAAARRRCRRPAVASGLRPGAFGAVGGSVPRRLARPVGACARPPLGRLPPPVRLAAARAAARPGSGGLRSPGWLRSPLGCSGLPLRVALRAAAGSRRPPWAARPRPGPPLRRPAGAALRLPSRLPPGGLWRGCAPLCSAPGPPASGGLGFAACGRRGAALAAMRLPALRHTKRRRYAPPRLRRSAYMRTAALSHLLTRHTACLPRRTAP